MESCLLSPFKGILMMNLFANKLDRDFYFKILSAQILENGTNQIKNVSNLELKLLFRIYLKKPRVALSLLLIWSKVGVSIHELCYFMAFPYLYHALTMLYM